MIPFIPIQCPRCNLPLIKGVQTTNMNSEYLFRCEEPRCINLSYSLDSKFLGLTYFISKQGSSTVVSLVPYDINDSYKNLRLDVGIGKQCLFSVPIPEFNPLDMSEIFHIVKTYIIFS